MERRMTAPEWVTYWSRALEQGEEEASIPPLVGVHTEAGSRELEGDARPGRPLSPVNIWRLKFGALYWGLLFHHVYCVLTAFFFV